MGTNASRLPKSLITRSHAGNRARIGNEKREIRIQMKGTHLNEDDNKSKCTRRTRGFLLSVLCAGVIAAFLGGCAEGPYVTAYDTGYYYPTGYYAPNYDYYGYPYSYYDGYGPTYSRTVGRSGVR
jgi:hypothetical protein